MKLHKKYNVVSEQRLKVTVAIPCYNGARYVGRAIESVLNQSRPADEVLVVDDGSTDDSAEIIRRYPVRLIQHDGNRGLSTARNNAIHAAGGDVLVFVDVDAFADSELLAELLRHYDDPKISGVGGQGIEMNVHSLADRWRQAHASQTHGKRSKDVEFLFGLCMSFRLDALKEIGGFDPAYRTNAEDVDMGIRLNAAGYRLRYEPKAKVYHQRSDDEASLRRAMTTWFTQAYRARKVNQAKPWKMFAGTLRRIVVDPLKDIFIIRDLALAPLSISIGFLKLNALIQAASTYLFKKSG